MNNCGNCRWFVEDKSPSGHCHRYPPVLLNLPNTEVGGYEVVAVYPFIPDTSGWCGEHKKEPTP